MYDALGRVRAHYPFADSTAVVDSFRYDLGSRPRFYWTRRGYQLEKRYDAVGRDTITLVPGVGNYRRTYGGPNGELTRMWIDSYVDSIGGVNPEVRWGYSQTGLLLADTAQGNRVTTFAKDRYGRDTLITDVTGNWRHGFDDTLGVLNSVATPFGDTLTWTYDERWRAIGPSIRNGSDPDYSLVPAWDSTGKLTEVSTTHVVAVGLWQAASEFEPYLPHDPVLPVWTETRGSGGATVTSVDSLTRDGWGRVTAARYMRNGVLVATDSFQFNRDGSARKAGETWSFDASTSRLLARPSGGGTTSYSFDAAGNLATVNDGVDSSTYTYDALDRLVSVRRNTKVIARYAYDVLGRRIVKRDSLPGSAVQYMRMVYRGDHVLAEADYAGALTFAYTWRFGTDNLVAIHRYSDGGNWYAVADQVGSVRGLTKRDGTWVVSWRYGVYGSAQTLLDSAGTAPFDLRYRWTGREYDRATGLYYFRARYYDPGAGRFIQEDPIRYAGGENLYAFGEGNPVNRDPSGLDTTPLFGGAGDCASGIMHDGACVSPFAAASSRSYLRNAFWRSRENAYNASSYTLNCIGNAGCNADPAYVQAVYNDAMFNTLECLGNAACSGNVDPAFIDNVLRELDEFDGPKPSNPMSFGGISMNFVDLPTIVDANMGPSTLGNRLRGSWEMFPWGSESCFLGVCTAFYVLYNGLFNNNPASGFLYATSWWGKWATVNGAVWWVPRNLGFPHHN